AAPVPGAAVPARSGGGWSWSLLAVHEGGALGAHDDVAVLVAPGVDEGDDGLAGAGAGGAHARHLGLAVEGVAVVQRVREGDLPEAEVRHEGALAELGDGCADDGGEGEHRVHQALPELGGAAPGGVEVEGLRVHGHGGEQDVVRLGEGAAGAVLVDRADLQLVRVQAALHDAGPAGVGVVRAHGRASWVSGAVSSVSTWASSSPRATFWPGRTCSRTTPASGAQRVCSIFIASTTSTAS